MRENGLRAAAYVAVVDLHPQVADAMLSALAANGVAAYATPVPGSRGLLMPAQFPTGPVDRLYVDRDAQDAAAQVLDAHLDEARDELEHVPSEPPTRDAGKGATDRPDGATSAVADVPAAPTRSDGSVGTDDTGDTRGDTHGDDHGDAHGDTDLPDAEMPGEVATAEPPDTPTTRRETDDGAPGRRAPDHVDDDTWGRIVASFHGGSADRAWPESEDVSSPTAERTEPTVVRRPLVNPAPATPARVDPADRFVPPLPPPLPMADSTTRMAWAGVVGGPLLFLLALLLDWQLASWAQLAGVAGLVGGFITLVARMRDDNDGHGGDQGAIV